MPLSADSLLQLKSYFDEQLEATLASLRRTDSDRLVKNKINGFLIGLQDKLFEFKPKLMCNNCGNKALANDESITVTPISPIMTHNDQHPNIIANFETSPPGYNKDYEGLAARSNLQTEEVSDQPNIELERHTQEIERLQQLMEDQFQVDAIKSAKKERQLQEETLEKQPQKDTGRSSWVNMSNKDGDIQKRIASIATP